MKVNDSIEMVNAIKYLIGDLKNKRKNGVEGIPWLDDISFIDKKIEIEESYELYIPDDVPLFDLSALTSEKFDEEFKKKNMLLTEKYNKKDHYLFNTAKIANDILAILIVDKIDNDDGYNVIGISLIDYRDPVNNDETILVD